MGQSPSPVEIIPARFVRSHQQAFFFAAIARDSARHGPDRGADATAESVYETVISSTHSDYSGRTVNRSPRLPPHRGKLGGRRTTDIEWVALRGWFALNARIELFVTLQGIEFPEVNGVRMRLLRSARARH